MKCTLKINRIIRIACFAVIVIALVGCQDEDLFGSNHRFEEGIPTRVSLGFVSQESKLETRVARPEVYEKRIENIYLFVFNQAGQRQPLLEDVTSGNLRNSNLFKYNGGLTPTDNNLSNGSGTLEFVCGSLNQATIVAIANVTEGTTSTAYHVTTDELDKIETISGLKSYVMSMQTSSIGRGALFMMTGYAEDGSGKDYDLYRYKHADMSMLSPEQRACLLDYLNGMHAQDIADKYGVKKPVVYCRIREAKRIIDTGSAHSEEEIAYRKEYAKRYYQEHAEQLKEYSRQYVSEHPGKAKEAQKRSYERNREKRIKDMKEYNKLYYQKNRERILTRMKERSRKQSKE